MKPKKKPQMWTELDHRIAIDFYIRFLESRGIAKVSRENYQQRLLLWYAYAQGWADKGELWKIGLESNMTTEIFHRMASAWVENLASHNLSPRTRQLYYSTLKSFSHWLKSKDLIKEELPFIKFKVPMVKERAVIPFDHAMSIIRGCLNGGERGWAMAVALGLCTGARLADVVHMQWCNIGPGTLDDMAFWTDDNPTDDKGMPVAPVVSYIPRKTASYNKVVRVPLAKELRLHLVNEIAYLRGQGNMPKPYSYLCPELQASYAKHGNKILSQRFPQLCLQMAMKYYTFHQLRHTFVTIMLKAGLNPAMVAQMTGHSLNQIMTYTHIDDLTLQSNLQKAFA